MLIIDNPDVTIVLIHIPKTAGTTLRRLITKCAVSKGAKIVNMRGPLSKTSCNGIYSYWQIYQSTDLAHIPLQYVNKYYPIDNSKPVRYVASVRCPYARTYSAYAWQQKERNQSVTNHDFNQFVVTRLAKIVTDYYESHAKGELPNYEYIHFMPMWMMLTDKNGSIHFDYMIRQEIFNQEILSLFDQLDFKLNDTDIQKETRHHATTNNYDNYVTMYNSVARRIVQILYRRDFIIFGYSS